MNPSQKINTINRLFTFFQDGEWDEAASLFSADAIITRQYGAQITPNSLTEFLHSLKEGPLSQVGIPQYKNRKVSLLNIEKSIYVVESHRHRLICDFIGSMTDRYAIDYLDRLTSIHTTRSIFFAFLKSDIRLKDSFIYKFY